MTTTTKIDTSGLSKHIADLKKLKATIAPQMYKDFVDATPVGSGHARRNTTLKNNSIIANYPYAGILDSGASSQAPEGMTKPTLIKMIDHINKFLRRK